MIHLSNIEHYQENNRIEAKKAAGGLPRSLWETYSAFANTFGGILLLGVEELPDHSLRVSGIREPERMVDEFLSLLNDPKVVSANILSPNDVRIREIDSKRIIEIEIPRAGRGTKPVYIGGDPYSGTYRRCGEGDYHCTPEEVNAMLRDRETGRDERLLHGFTLTALDWESVARYRQRFNRRQPGHAWKQLSDKAFAAQAGAIRKDKEGWWRPTAAGLLMFGREVEISRAFPGYFLAYRERRTDGSWQDVVLSTTGDWSGNLCDFFFCVFDKITSAFLSFLGPGNQGETSLRSALQEALGNAVIHADYDGGNGLMIQKDRDGIVITNPGGLRVTPDDALTHGASDLRNASLGKMFALVGVGHGEGSGLRFLQTVWEQYHLGTPQLQEQFNPDMVMLHLTIEADFIREQELRQAVVDCLTGQIEMTAKELAIQLRLASGRLQDVLHSLRANGVIVSGTRGGYRLKR